MAERRGAELSFGVKAGDYVNLYDEDGKLGTIEWRVLEVNKFGAVRTRAGMHAVWKKVEKRRWNGWIPSTAE